jgi:hypothetical protein
MNWITYAVNRDRDAKSTRVYLGVPTFLFRGSHPRCTSNGPWSRTMRTVLRGTVPSTVKPPAYRLLGMLITRCSQQDLAGY